LLAPAARRSAFYEKFGEERVASGVYPVGLRWLHVKPVFGALAARLGRIEAT
jgi:hypothetical protein